MARLVRTTITWEVPMSLRALSRLLCLSFVTVTLRQTWPQLPLSAPWMNARTSSKSAAQRHVVESPWIPTLVVWDQAAYSVLCEYPFLPIGKPSNVIHANPILKYGDCHRRLSDWWLRLPANCHASTWLAPVSELQPVGWRFRLCQSKYLIFDPMLASSQI